jgi:CHAT domain-containing protein
MDKIKVLLLAADPTSLGLQPRPRLLLDEEIRAIKVKLRAADYREALDFVPHLAARADDLLQALNEHRPHVVQFSGHGSRADEILLAGEDGNLHAVDKKALVSIFRTLKDNVRLVVLNACFSRAQAKSITQVIDGAVGMSRAISDRAAVTFAATFYRVLGFGHSVLHFPQET